MRWDELDGKLRYEMLAWHAPFWEPLIAWGLAGVGDLDGKRILEIGCGDGGLACLLARCGAEVCATDLLPSRLSRAACLVAQNDLEHRVHLICSNAYALPFLSGSFDLVITRSVLVLLDRRRVLPDLVRQLAPNVGVALFIENMDQHPAVSLWRALTGTKWGTQPYLSVGEIHAFHQYFTEVQSRFAGILMPLASGFGRYEGAAALPLIKIDNVLLRAVPHLSKFAWLVALRCVSCDPVPTQVADE